MTDARDRFIDLAKAAFLEGTLVKLTLGKPGALASEQPTLRNLYIRPVLLSSGPHLSFVWHHQNRDITKNLSPGDALRAVQSLIGGFFLDAHLFTPAQTAQLETDPKTGQSRLRVTVAANAPAIPPSTHDRPKEHLIPAGAPWLRALGVTNDRGQPREGMGPKLRQIQKFAELLTHLLAEAGLTPSDSAADLTAVPPPGDPIRLTDMGSGKGYLTFAVASLLGATARVTGVERRPELVALCNEAARKFGLTQLSFVEGDIASVAPGPLDVLIALHACDTATDDALAAGIASGARLLVVSPCCQKEIRPQLTAPPILADALRHGIFQERHAEFATDALRALLLEWAGYHTQVCEFVSTEHTAKNLMISAVRNPASPPPLRPEPLAQRIRAFAAFYGIRQHALATHLAFPLQPSPTAPGQSGL